MKYSVIIPVMNEEKNVVPLHNEIRTTMDSLGQPYEIIFIDDGSTDGTVAQLETVSPVVIVRLRKNFGQTAAMDAGIKQATGEIVITLDGDGQNPPSEIPKVLKVMEEGKFDIVSGWRKKRKDPFFKRFVSRGAFALRSVFVRDHIHDSGCSLKAYKRECFDNVDLFGEMHRFIPAILSWSGFSVGEVEVVHRPRNFGTTKYNWKRVLKGFIDMIAISFWRKYASRPLHLFGSFSAVLIGLSGALLVYLGIKRLVFSIPISGSSLPLLAVLLAVIGMQFFVSGILADIGIKNYYNRDRRPYSVASVTVKK
jgi:glycosyltransferase involved in cell wall biosynthesis